VEIPKLRIGNLKDSAKGTLLVVIISLVKTWSRAKTNKIVSEFFSLLVEFVSSCSCVKLRKN